MTPAIRALFLASTVVLGPQLTGCMATAPQRQDGQSAGTPAAGASAPDQRNIFQRAADGATDLGRRAVAAVTPSDAPAAEADAAPAPKLIHPRLQAALDKATAAKKVSFDAEKFYAIQSKIAAGGPATNPNATGNIQGQANAAAGRVVQGAVGQGTVGRILSPMVDSTFRQVTQNQQQARQVYAAIDQANKFAAGNAGQGIIDSQAVRIIRLAELGGFTQGSKPGSSINDAMGQRAKDEAVGNAGREIIKHLPQPKGQGGVIGDLLNKIGPK